MTDNRKAGIALIAGSIGGIVTMAIHPVPSRAPMSADRVQHLMSMSPIAHSLAIASFVLLFLGACGLARHLARPNRLAFCALVTFGFACVAILNATAVSGFIVPGIMKLMVQDVASAAPQWHIAMASIFQINQAMAKIYTVLASVATVLWSIAGLRGGLSRFVAIFGCIVAPLVALLVMVGHLRLDVHGMTAIMLSEVIWFVGAGAGLMRADAVRDQISTSPSR